MGEPSSSHALLASAREQPTFPCSTKVECSPSSAQLNTRADIPFGARYTGLYSRGPTHIEYEWQCCTLFPSRAVRGCSKIGFAAARSPALVGGTHPSALARKESRIWEKRISNQPRSGTHFVPAHPRKTTTAVSEERSMPTAVN